MAAKPARTMGHRLSDLSHLAIGAPLPRIKLDATTGDRVCLADLAGRSVVYCYPWTGRPGLLDPPHWDDIPGAHGSTPETEGFRDLHPAFTRAGVDLFGVSTQTTDYQREMVARLGVRFPVLSDASLAFAAALSLPSFETGGAVYLERLTLLIREGRIEHVFYPVTAPADHAAEVLRAIG